MSLDHYASAGLIVAIIMQFSAWLFFRKPEIHILQTVNFYRPQEFLTKTGVILWVISAAVLIGGLVVYAALVACGVIAM